MPESSTHKEGGLRAAFFFLLLAVAVFDYGTLLVLRLGLLRVTAFAAAVLFLWKNDGRTISVGVYPLLVGGFVLLALGHAFSSIYPWVSFQHAFNIALAATLLAWAYRLFRQDPEAMWDRTVLWICGIAAVQLGIAMWQRFSLGNLRPNGTFNTTNFLAEFLAVAALLCVSVALRSAAPRTARVAGAVGAAAFFGGALSLASSRGVLLACVPAVALQVAARYGWRKGGKILLALAFPLIAILGIGALRRFSEPDPYTYARLLVWKSAFLTFLEHPFGVGLGGFKYLWFAKQFPVEGAFLRYGRSAVYAHNEYLEVLVGIGCLGFLLFLAVLSYPLAAACRRWGGVPAERRGMVAAAGSALLLGGLHAAFDFNFHEIGLVFASALLTGSLLAFLPDGETSGRRAVPRWGAKAMAGVAAILLAASAATMAAGIAYKTGKWRLEQGELSRAEAAFRFAVRADPYRTTYPDGLSLVFYRRYQREARNGGTRPRLDALLSDAIPWESRALAGNPWNYVTVSRLSMLYTERARLSGRGADWDAALALSAKAISENPFSPMLLVKQADLYLARGETREAEADLVRAVSLEPNFCRGYATLSALDRAVNSHAVSPWAEKEDACRKRAQRFTPEENEKWMVE